jgi:phosphoribosyl-ATP pyrophosphohydrolase
MTEDRLLRLSETIRARRGADPDSSYVARLLAKGGDRIAQKLGEEAVETVIAATKGDAQALVSEAADLLFHLAVLLESQGLGLDAVLRELERREGVSGLKEKASRSGVMPPQRGD